MSLTETSKQEKEKGEADHELQKCKIAKLVSPSKQKRNVYVAAIEQNFNQSFTVQPARRSGHGFAVHATPIER